MDLLLWDPTELAAPAAAQRWGVPHVGVNFLARPPYSSGDWWCEFMARWTDLVHRCTVPSPVREAVGDVLDVVPRWFDRPPVSSDEVTYRSIVVRPDESLFEVGVQPLGPSDGLILLSTAYRTASATITDLISGVRRAGLRPVVVAARSAGAPALDTADLVMDQALVGQLIGSCAALVTAAGTHSVLTALGRGVPTVAVPVRVHSYWELESAVDAGIALCPGDSLTPGVLSGLVSRAPGFATTAAPKGTELASIVEDLVDATG